MKVCLLAAIVFVSVSAFTKNNQELFRPKARISILVYNDAEIPRSELTQAEMTAQRILDRVGVEIVWIDCNSSGSFSPQPNACTEAFSVLHVRLNVLPQPTPQFRSADSVFGYAVTEPEKIGPACYLFYDRAKQLGDSSGFGVSLVAGHVIAHELGHLLLGSNAHSSSGIMSAVLDREKIKAASVGHLGFSPEQRDKMRSMIRRVP